MSINCTPPFLSSKYQTIFQSTGVTQAKLIVTQINIKCKSNFIELKYHTMKFLIENKRKLLYDVDMNLLVSRWKGGKMQEKRYLIQMEIAGNTAMWTRPDTGDSPISYPAPTFSAVKSIFESILWGPAIEYSFTPMRPIMAGLFGRAVQLPKETITRCILQC